VPKVSIEAGVRDTFAWYPRRHASDGERGDGAKHVIPNAVPHLAGNEWKYVKECLDTNWVSSVGPFVSRFERGVSAYVGVATRWRPSTARRPFIVALLARACTGGRRVLVPR
jgi:perosamine synthetase